MSIATVITEGFGAAGSPALVVTMGYSIGAATRFRAHPSTGGWAQVAEVFRRMDERMDAASRKKRERLERELRAEAEKAIEQIADGAKAPQIQRVRRAVDDAAYVFRDLYERILDEQLTLALSRDRAAAEMRDAAERAAQEAHAREMARRREDDDIVVLLMSL